MLTDSINSTESSASAGLSPRRVLTILLAALVALAIPASLAFQLRVAVENGFSDFQGFYDAATIIDSGDGARLYDLSLYDQPRLKNILKVPGIIVRHYYIHAPFEAIFFLPLARLPFVTAAWVWWTFSLLCAFLTLFVLLPFIASIKERIELGLVSVTFFIPTISTLFQGQDTIVTLLLFAICYRSLVRGRYTLAGCALAVAMYKPPLALPMILLLAIVSKERWKLVTGFLGTFSFLVCVAILKLGWACVAGYPSLLSRFSTYEEGHYHLADMPNVRGLATLALQHLLSERVIFVVVAVLSMAVLVLSVWAVKKIKNRPEAHPLVFSLFVAASVLVGYQEYAYDLALLYLPVLLTWDSLYQKDQNSRDRGLLTISTMLLLFGSFLSLAAAPLYACVIVFFFAVLARQLHGLACATLVSDRPIEATD
ncbi:glycosyltransferase family 87 protein [Occallatibacter savannae]|uniref:glycosyltransferase family 87 protein n=1 Tax=Occallatibacter savannae TaxID=1002691 RepID=UPI0013A5B541|nr:glycosyltransferase family 87 protein [Occallatibacter savannae]